MAKGVVQAIEHEAHRFDDLVAVRVVRISEALARTATRTIEARWGLANTDLRMLNTLDGEMDGLPVSEIARRVHVDKGWVSRSLRALEQRQLVERRADPKDTRQMLVVLSAEGRARLDEVRPYVLRSEARMLDGIDEQVFKAMLDRLEANATAQLEALG